VTELTLAIEPSICSLSQHHRPHSNLTSTRHASTPYIEARTTAASHTRAAILVNIGVRVELELARVHHYRSNNSTRESCITTLKEIHRTNKVLIVADNVSAEFGGEAFLPLHYFEILRERGIDAHLLTHIRRRDEICELFPDELERIHYVADRPIQQRIWKLSDHMPTVVHEFTLAALSNFIQQHDMRNEAKRLVQRLGITVVHQPTPVTPRMPSAIYDVGAPVVIGPMNGNMEFPAGFGRFRTPMQRAIVHTVRQISELANIMTPGKRRAAALLVANDRTEEGLPACCAGVPVREIVENGVNLDRFTKVERQPRVTNTLRLAFLGRLVDWKGVELLLEALVGIDNVVLDILGDGQERASLEAKAAVLGLKNVNFKGFVPQELAAVHLETVDALVLPSLYECGGAVVLEAMAKSLPVIATRWGGPADYLDDTCGILVSPTNRDEFIRGLRAAIVKLANDPVLCVQLGKAGRDKIDTKYNWDHKIDQILDVYRDVVAANDNARAAPYHAREYAFRARASGAE
jgi:glycosyltransferase involved in cell wall biosynthesis